MSKLQVKLKSKSGISNLVTLKPKVSLKLKPQSGVYSETETLVSETETLVSETETLVPNPKSFQLQQHGTLLYLKNDVKSTRVASFDLDGTLITTRSGYIYASDAQDWIWVYPQIPEVLRHYHDQGYKLIIFSNQSGMSKDSKQYLLMVHKLQAIYEQLNLPIEIYIATAKDNYRKPMTDMWDFANLGLVDLVESFYCGDAAGRMDNYLPGRKKDFNITDRYFARNIGISFYVPEAIFSTLEKEFIYCDPYHNLLSPLDDYIQDQDYPLPQNFSIHHRNLIILVGPPGSGKTSFSQNPKWNGYMILNNDTLMNPKKLQTLFNQALSQGQSILIDNTNPKAKTRLSYITLAQAQGYQCYAYQFDFPKELSIHLNHMRCQMSHGQKAIIPIIATHTYYKQIKATPPCISEGFKEVIFIKGLMKSSQKNDFFQKYYKYNYDFKLK